MRIVDADLLIKYVKDNFIGVGCNGEHQKEFIDAISELAGGDYVHEVTSCEACQEFDCFGCEYKEAKEVTP